MKRRTTVITLLLLAAAVVLPQKSQAQFQVGAAFGTDTEIGIMAGYYMPLSVGDVEGLSVGVDGVFYLPNSQGFPGGEVDVTYFEVNVNGHYNALEVGESGIAYAIGGLQYARISADAVSGPFGTSFDFSSSDIGLNIGAGVGFGKLFGEAKFGLGGFEQLVLSGGYKF